MDLDKLDREVRNLRGLVDKILKTPIGDLVEKQAAQPAPVPVDLGPIQESLDQMREAISHIGEVAASTSDRLDDLAQRLASLEDASRPKDETPQPDKQDDQQKAAALPEMGSPTQ